MIRIGIHDAVGSEYVHAYDPSTDRMILRSELDKGVSMISVTFNNIDLVVKYSEYIFAFVSKNTGQSWRLLTGWGLSGDLNNGARSRLREKRFTSEGFHFTSNGGHRIGVSRPFMYGFVGTGMHISSRKVYGLCLHSEDILRDDLTPVTELVLASSRSFAAPTPQTRNLLKAVGDTVAFVVLGNSIRPGIVLLTRGHLALSGLFSLDEPRVSVVYDDEADSVWRL